MTAAIFRILLDRRKPRAPIGTLEDVMTLGNGMAGAARCLGKWNGCLAIIAVSAWSVGAWGVGAAAQGQEPRTSGKAPATASGTRWTSPRTPWGDPDLQGLWPSLDMQGTPYERPPNNLAGRTGSER